MRRSKYRTFHFFLLLVGISLGACSKAPVSPEDAAAALLVGRWELIQTDGGLTGQLQPADPSEKREIVFKDNKATFLRNGVVMGASSYSLFQANSYVNRRPQTFVAYGARSRQEKEFIERISATELVVVEDYADGLGYYYTRR